PDGTLWTPTPRNAWLASKGVNTQTEGADVLIGGTADDTLNALGGDDTVSGGVGNDILAGGSGNDRLFGNAGSDVLDGGTGLDTLQGGPGDDLYIIDNTGDAVLENANEGSDTISSPVSYSLSSVP